MLKLSLFFATALACAISAGPASASEYGTTEEAKAMLARAITAVRTNPATAIEKFNYNERPFRDRDLFVFCFDGKTGIFTAHEAMVGSNVRELRDGRGYRYGAEMYAQAHENEVTEVAMMSPLPGSTAQIPRPAFVTRVGEQVCGVSAFLQPVPTTWAP